MIRSGHRWTTKPPLGSTPDSTHPLCPARAFLLNEGSGPQAFDVVGRTTGTLGTAVLRTLGPRGATIQTGASLSAGFVGAITNPLQATKWTLAARVLATSLTPFGSLYINDAGSLGWYLDSGKLRYYPQAAVGTTLVTNRWYDVVVTQAGSSLTYYVDGVAVGSTASAASLPATANIGGHPSSETLAGQFEYLFAYDRALSAAQVVALSADPYSFIPAPATRRYATSMAAVSLANFALDGGFQGAATNFAF